ncbi:hypothetical protein NDU88_003456 [Pleurodeles waltl]|uniref:Uncharacterized protein n=1 Tax=Pleurodeles waltl TaxID=8319 RepID=A0AAV7LH10_PLEWA|nr:hypothetical protein NDU88_003456 [Pleurodeles waltl]
MEPGSEKGPDMPAEEEQDLRQIFWTMQQSLTQIAGKTDSFSYRIDRMTERLDKHAKRLDQLERRVSEVEDGQTQLTASHVKINKEVHTLHLKVDDLEARVTLDREALLDYLTHIDMPQLTDEDRAVLMAPLTLEEMDGALRGMAEGKAPALMG